MPFVFTLIFVYGSIIVYVIILVWQSRIELTSFFISFVMPWLASIRRVCSSAIRIPVFAFISTIIST